jgi:micrococcal nuclease
MPPDFMETAEENGSQRTVNMYEYRVDEVIDIIDGDTIDVKIDLGFDISLKKRVRLTGIDTPESRTTDLREKKYGLQAKEWLKHKLENAHHIVIRTELPDSTEKYGRILGTLFVGGEEISINDQLIKGGYAWAYEGGTKHKDFAALDALRTTPL